MRVHVPLVLIAAVLVVALSGCGALPEVPPPQYQFPIPSQGGR
jgi:hypothetical protein